MTLHRTESHALFYLTLLSPLLAWLWLQCGSTTSSLRRTWLAVWLVLVTHPLLDTMTVYGTQLALPFSNYPFGVGSIFIIDPLYTLPLVVGVCLALAWVRRRPVGALRANAWGLALSCPAVGAKMVMPSVASNESMPSSRSKRAKMLQCAPP